MIVITHEEMKPIFVQDVRLKKYKSDKKILGHLGELIQQRCLTRMGCTATLSENEFDSKKDMNVVWPNGHHSLLEQKTGAVYASKSIFSVDQSQANKLLSVDHVGILTLSPNRLVWPGFRNFKINGQRGDGLLFILEKNKFKLLSNYPWNKCSVRFCELQNPVARLDDELLNYLHLFVSAQP